MIPVGSTEYFTLVWEIRIHISIEAKQLKLSNQTLLTSTVIGPAWSRLFIESWILEYMAIWHRHHICMILISNQLSL